MKVVFICFLTFALATAGVRQCVNHCTQDTNSGCHHNQICVHQGCNHYCEFILPKRLVHCPMVMCALFCENGFKTSPETGCFACACA